jgi:cytochrome b
LKAEERTAAEGAARIRVWDAPTRTFHWLYVAAFAAAWLTLDTTLLDWHVLAGYVALGLLAFRVAWGFAGTHHARFASFAAGPGAVWRYLRGLQRREPIHYAGHNPAGGWSIFLMVALGIAIGVTGILALGAMYGYGPLASTASPSSAATLREVHEVLAWILLALVPIHLAGVAVGSLAGRENLVRSMIDGRKNASGDSSGVASRTLIAISLVAVAAAGAIAYRRHADTAIASARKPLKATAGDAMEKAWNDECGSCHFAFPASLAPERIWRAMLEPTADHFGEALDLAAPRRAALTTYAASHSADRVAPTWLAERLSHTEWRSQRITGTPFWRRRHDDIDFAALKKSGRVASAIDCAACHHDAASGGFAPRAIEMP